MQLELQNMAYTLKHDQYACNQHFFSSILEQDIQVVWILNYPIRLAPLLYFSRLAV